MTKDFVIWVYSISGSTYYVDKNFNLIRVSGELTYEEFKKNAKQYSEKAYKRIFTLLHKKYPFEILECQASSLSLHFETYHTYKKNDIKYVVL